MEEFYLLISGGRNFFNYDYLMKKCDYLLQNHKDKKIIIVSGLASGTDSLGELYSLDKNYEFIGKKANWNKYKHFAGSIRNQEMANLIKNKKFKACVCFWDGKSKGTKNMISICKKQNIPLRIYNYQETSDLYNTCIKRSVNENLYCCFKNKNLSNKQLKLKFHLDRLKIFNFIEK